MTEMTDMKVIRMTNTPPRQVEDLVPYPASAEEVTALALARYYAAEAYGDAVRSPLLYDAAVKRPTPSAWRVYGQNADLMRAGWAISYLLAKLAVHAPEHANEAALTMWTTMENGCVPGSLQAVLTDMGIDHEEIARLARAQEGHQPPTGRHLQAVRDA